MEVVQDIYCVKLPLPYKENSINCYLVKGDHGWSVVDTGTNFDLSLNQWKKAFLHYGIEYSNIDAIYITHLHPAHFGAAKWMQQLTGAPVYMSQSEIDNVESTWKKVRINIPVLGEFFKENGVPPGLLSELLENIYNIAKMVCPCAALSPLPLHGEVRIGKRLFRVIETPGHTEGHVVFFESQEGILFAGDHLLPTADSKICMWPTSNPNPLSQFFKSLKVVEELAVKRVLPAHGGVFYDCLSRYREIKAYKQFKIKQILGLLSKRINAYQICQKLYIEDLPPKDVHSKLTEILAFLAYLESNNLVETKLENGIITYRIRQ